MSEYKTVLVGLPLPRRAGDDLTSAATSASLLMGADAAGRTRKVHAELVAATDEAGSCVLELAEELAGDLPDDLAGDLPDDLPDDLAGDLADDEDLADEELAEDEFDDDDDLDDDDDDDDDIEDLVDELDDDIHDLTASAGGRTGTPVFIAGVSDLVRTGILPEPDDADGGPVSWQERALCAQTDPEAFFPEKGGSTREAKRVCLSCDVRAECLEYALANDERFGIWGGLSERERRRVKKQAV